MFEHRGRSILTNHHPPRRSFEDEQAQAHNGRLSLFVLMFIDGSSVIDASDTRWHTFTTYKRGATAAEPPRVVAYTTVYPFVAMVGGELVERYRLSQILVLPPYQRGGHGSALLQVAHTAAETAPLLQPPSPL